MTDLRKLWRRTSLLAIAVLFVAGCSQTADTEELIDAVQVGAMVPLPDNALRYGERMTGAIFDVDENGNKQNQPVAKVDIARGGERGLLGMTMDDRGRTFAAWTAPDNTLTVGQVAPGPVRAVWTGPQASTTHIGGRLQFSPQKRLLLSIGDLQRPELANDPVAPNGKLATLDPDGAPTQRANFISRGWNDPGGVAYDRAGNLWVADDRNGKAELVRAGEGGPLSDGIELGDNVAPVGMTAYGERELVVCSRNNRDLDRFLVDQNVRAVRGRKVAEDCGGPVAQLADGRLAYATDTAIRITSK